MKTDFDHGTIHHGDCLELMRDIPKHSIDMILADLPYGQTELKWDTMIPMDQLWHEYMRILKPCRAVVLTAMQPFTSKLVLSNPAWFKYEVIWHKSRKGSFAQAHYRFLNEHENILIFSDGNTVENAKKKLFFKPQGVKKCKIIKKDYKSSQRQNRSLRPTYIRTQKNFPGSVLKFSNDDSKIHPTQKPVALFEYLIMSFSDKNETVLDNTIGSGTTAVAAYNTGRRFIGIEKDREIYESSVQRIDRDTKQLQLFP